jgi:hypothetical protein
MVVIPSAQKAKVGGLQSAANIGKKQNATEK